jgi:hypothetical protein
MAASAAVPWSLIVLLAGTVPTLTLIGMEHTLHALVTVWFLVTVARHAAAPAAARAGVALPVLAALVTLTRYEGVFAIVCASGAFAFTRKWRHVVAVTVAAAIPVMAFGAWSMSQGGYLLPNSVLLKGVMPSLSLLGLLQQVTLWPGVSGVVVTPHLAAIVAVVVVLALLPSIGSRQRERYFLAALLVGSAVLHMQFARAGWFFRYEAYLVIAGLVLTAMLAHGTDWTRVTAARHPVLVTTVGLVVVGVLAFPIARRARVALILVPAAASNIFEQQYQAGLFLDEFYAGQRVAVNDVGAIGYLADVTLLDIYGLASQETAALRRAGAFTTAAIDQLAARDGVTIALIYPTWLDESGGVPARWQKVGSWQVAENVVLGENGVSFFAVGAGARDPLVRHLAAFSPRLPATVRQEGDYLAVR